MSMFRRACASLVATLALIALAAPGASAHTVEYRKPPKLSYVALGDSFAAGVGAAPAQDACLSSALAYPRLIARFARMDLTMAACAGATLTDVTNNQLSALKPSTDYVTVQAGGNDIGFEPILRLCGLPGNDATCIGAVKVAAAELTSSKFADDARTLFAGVRARAPKARVIVVGYPRLFSGKDCSPPAEYSAAEQSEMNATVGLLNQRLRRIAYSVGARFADPTAAFANHAWCAKRSWINGPEHVVAFHPNALGQLLGYAPVVARKFF
ncbi:MAG: SGNH/GDSL hydrolase family protein [Micropruina sp.]|uniref:SGNH/GDSL hydrolase family protein n=1 Tax=Micropruina sp. TaxID=2737536 RepID=UPI0039E314EC